MAGQCTLLLSIDLLYNYDITKQLMRCGGARVIVVTNSATYYYYESV